MLGSTANPGHVPSHADGTDPEPKLILQSNWSAQEFVSEQSGALPVLC